MPRIDPVQLLKILGILLSPNGGIKSQAEVLRLVSLMTKFSKKLVSKCIYISILKATDPDLLVLWMSKGGWDLIHNWLIDGVNTQNWPLVIELEQLLLICPVDIDRLKTNRCPKLIKTLSKNTESPEDVTKLASEIVLKWLAVVNNVLAKQQEESIEEEEEDEDQKEDNGDVELDTSEQCDPEEVSDEADVSDGAEQSDKTRPEPSVYKVVIKNGKEVLSRVVKNETNLDSSAADSDMCVNDVPEESAKSKIKVKKGADVDRVKKTKSETENSKENKSNSKNKSDPTKDRRKDKLRQVRKDSGMVFIDSDDSDKSDKVRPSKRSLSSSAKDSKKFKSKTGELDKVKSSGSASNSSNSLSGSDKSNAKKDSLIKDKSAPDISKLGRIPKKSSLDSKDKKDGDQQKSESADKKSSDKDRSSKDSKKLPAPPPPKPEKDSKKYNISVEARKVAPGESRPKTVKTFHSKFRSTGLEEELPPPPQVKGSKKNSSVVPSNVKKPTKRSSPVKETQPPEKKLKAEPPTSPVVSDVAKTVPELTTPDKDTSKSNKAKPIHLLQESDSFMVAINAASTMKEPRKRKRRMSGGKEALEAKKETNDSDSPTQTQSPPAIVKPNFKFYQDTLSVDYKAKTDQKEEAVEENKSVSNKTDNLVIDKSMDVDEDDISKATAAIDKSVAQDVLPLDDEVVNTEEEIKNEENRQNSDGLRGVLVYAKLRKGPKKKVSWRSTLEDVKHFVLDETERVNVTKTFMDMKQMERIHERENFAIARKLTNADIMEEKIRWKPLIPCDAPALPVIPGNNSNEKEVQYAREKTVLSAIYFNKRLIPDSPAEPDLEIHATTDPTIIPLDDVSGNEDSINDFTNTTWPESKVSSAQETAPITVPQGPPGIMGPGPMPNFMPGPGFQNNAGPPPGLLPVPVMGPNMPFSGFSGPPGHFGPPQMGPVPPGPMGMPPNDWRAPNPDMKVGVGPNTGPSDMFGPGPPGIMGPPGLLPMPDMPFGMQPPGPMGPPDDMNFPGGPYSMNQGPSGPNNMYQGGGPPFHGGNNSNNQGNKNWFRQNGPGSRNDDDRDHRGPPRGGGNFRNKRGNRNGDRGSRGNDRGGSWRGVSRGSKGGDGWRGSDNNNKPVCNTYAKWGYCRSNNCSFRHPQ